MGSQAERIVDGLRFQKEKTPPLMFFPFWPRTSVVFVKDSAPGSSAHVRLKDRVGSRLYDSLLFRQKHDLNDAHSKVIIYSNIFFFFEISFKSERRNQAAST